MFLSWGDINCLQGASKDVATLGCAPIIFLNVVHALLLAAGAFALYHFLIGSFKYINSAGDAKKLESARNTLGYGILGFIIVITSFLMINLVSYITGVKCITSFGFGCH